MNHLKKLGLSIALLTFIVSACSSGGGGGGTPSVKTTKISGSVSGTTIIAVNDAGDIVATDDTDGQTPDAQGNFPFTLSDIPVGSNVRVFLIVGSGIYPMYFDSNGDSTPDTNVFNPGGETEVSLGFVNTQVAGQVGRAVPENNPVNISGIVSANANETVPDSLFNPDTGELTLAELLEKGLAAIRNGWIQGADTYLEKAVEVAGAETSDDADTARFFYAMIRVGALAGETLSDGNSDDLNRLGDYLDKLGCDTSDTRRSNGDAAEGLCPEDQPLPADSPTGADYQALLANLVGREIADAIDNLDAISTSFNRKEVLGEDTVELDYGDVLVLRAGFKGALALIKIEDAYNLNVDLDFKETQASNPQNTAEAVLARNTRILALENPENLAEAKTLLLGSVNDVLAAIASIQAESDVQTDDLINLLGDEDETPEKIAADIAEAQSGLQEAMNCLNGTTDCQVAGRSTPDSSDDLAFTLQPLFTGLMDFNNILPTFTGGTPGFFNDDGTIAGSMISGVDINEDINPANGIPDIIDRLNG